MDIIKELWGYMRSSKKYWLTPVIIILLLMGVLLVVTEGTALAPFIYTVF